MDSIGNYNVKAVASCIRFPERLGLDQAFVVKENSAPASGDVVLLRCLESTGAYKALETRSGENTPLGAGDVFLAVLGDRFSGTNIFGVMPKKAMRDGDKLDLVAIGGVVARAEDVPGYLGGTTLSAEIIGFPVNQSKEKLNIINSGIQTQIGEIQPAVFDCIVVCGTSAEVGKTTLTCDIGKRIKAFCPDLTVGAVKACGTGRIKDLKSYQKAGFDVTTDYVEFGLPTTYGLIEPFFDDVLHQMTNYVGGQTKVVMLEVGGDLYEANAPTVIKLGKQFNAQFVFAVNDAMGAKEALRVFDKYGILPSCIASFKQNMRALAERIQRPDIHYLDMNKPADLDALVAEKLFPNFRHSPASLGGVSSPAILKNRI